LSKDEGNKICWFAAISVGGLERGNKEYFDLGLIGRAL
jgi:hypothetical protein